MRSTACGVKFMTVRFTSGHVERNYPLIYSAVPAASPETGSGSGRLFANITPKRAGLPQKPFTRRTVSPGWKIPRQARPSLGGHPSTCRAAYPALRWKSPTSTRNGYRTSQKMMHARRGGKPEFRIVVARSDGGPDYHIPCSYRGGFANTWNAIYAKRPGLSWDENPWIWAITFSVETSHEN